MKVLEQFLIGLGLQVDKKSFDNGAAAFDGLSKSALQLGGVLATKLGIQKVVGDFTNAGVALDNFNKLNGSSVENVQRLGYALKQQGGNAADAFSMIKNIQNLMASPLTRNTGWMGEAARFGLDPRAITDAKSTKDAILNVADAFEHMNQVQQVQAGKALGWDDAQIRLAQSGRAEIEKMFAQADKYNLLNEKQTKDAQRLSGAMVELNKTFESVGNVIAGELTPAVAEMVENFNQFYQDNKELIDSGLKEFFGGVAENIELVTGALIVLGGTSALKGIAALASVAGLGSSGAAAIAAREAAKKAAQEAARAAIERGVIMPTAAVSTTAVATAGLAALLYSSSLNKGEDEIVRKRKEAGDRDADKLAGMAVQHFMKSGWTRQQAIGIVANLDQESSLDPTAIGDGGKAVGVAQWHPDRQAEFKKWKGKDIRQSTLEDQLDFVNYELSQGKERSAGDKLRGTSSASEAASIVSKYYERPADREGEATRRGAKAEQMAAQDNRQFHFHGADETMVKRVIRAEVGEMASQAMSDMKSSEE